MKNVTRTSIAGALCALILGVSAPARALTVQVGPQLMLAAKLRMRPGLSIEEACEAINALEVRLKASVPEIGWCFMEPDVRD